jgi:hypothetical protein
MLRALLSMLSFVFFFFFFFSPMLQEHCHCHFLSPFFTACQVAEPSLSFLLTLYNILLPAVRSNHVHFSHPALAPGKQRNCQPR